MGCQVAIKHFQGSGNSPFMIDHERWHDLEKSSETYPRKRLLESISLPMTSQVSQFNRLVLWHLKMALEDMSLIPCQSRLSVESYWSLFMAD